MELVHFVATDGLRLDGLLACPKNVRAIVVHVHGKCGNFYQNDFLRYMFRAFSQNGIGLLAFNNRGHDCIAEGYRGGRLTYVGGSVETFEDCVIDILAAVDYASTYSPTVFLQGHSNGCEKVLHFISASGYSARLRGAILLSPSDSYALHEKYIAPRTVPDHIASLTERFAANLDAFVDASDYGIRVKGRRYYIPITARSLLSLETGAAFKILRYDVPNTDFQWGQPVLVCFGKEDPYQTVPYDVAYDVLRRALSNATLRSLEGDHHFRGHETALAGALSDWVGSLL